MKDGFAILFRMLVFLVGVTAVYAVFRQTTHVLFGARLEALGPRLPGGRVIAGDPAGLGVRVANNGKSDGAAFVVAVLPSGEEVEGPMTEVPGGDTVLVPVEVALGRGEHVMSLVLFDGWRGVRRLRTYHGLLVGVGPREIHVEGLAVPELVGGDGRSRFELRGTNPGLAAEAVVPAVLFRAGGRKVAEVEGPAVEIAPGEAHDLLVNVDPGALPPGSYTAELFVRSASGEVLGRARFPFPVDFRR